MPRYTIQVLTLHEITVNSLDDIQAIRDALTQLSDRGETPIYHRVCLAQDRSEIQGWNTAEAVDSAYQRDYLQLPGAEKLHP